LNFSTSSFNERNEQATDNPHQSDANPHFIAEGLREHLPWIENDFWKRELKIRKKIKN
jgi:hypothetical protein